MYQKFTATEINIDNASKKVIVGFTFDLDEGSFAAGAIVPEYYSVFSDAISLPELTKEDYAFDGWYESASFDGDSVTVIPLGSSGNKNFYAKFVAPYAYIGDIPYSSLSKLTAAITNASSTADITVSLTSNVTQADLGKAETSATIAYSISKTKAKSLSLVVPEAEKIEFSAIFL